jgi:hypothetical protein
VSFNFDDEIPIRGEDCSTLDFIPMIYNVIMR